MSQEGTIVAYLLGGLIALAIIYYATRFLFSIDKFLEQQETTNELLRQIAEKDNSKP